MSATQAMPLGNGRLGAAVWGAEGLTVQLNRADTMPYRNSPGQVIVPGLSMLTEAADYSGHLDLYRGEFVESGAGMHAAVYVDPERDVLIIDVKGADPKAEQITELRLWSPRSPRAEVKGRVGILSESWRDVDLPGASGGNFGSLSAITAEGRLVRAERKDGRSIKIHFYPFANGSFRVLVGAPHFSGAEDTHGLTERLFQSRPTIAKNEAWWGNFWKRACPMYITSPDGAGEYMEALRVIDLFTSSAEGRGTFPGSHAGVADLFSSVKDIHHWDPAGYWHWNLRMQVSANLGAGLPELNQPYFRLYQNNLANMSRWTKDHWNGRPGICLPETMRFNGNGIIYEAKGPTRSVSVESSNCDATSKPYYNARTLSTGAEVAVWIWRQYLATGDRKFLSDHFSLLEAASEFLISYEKPGDDHLLHTAPSNAHETQWDTSDPTTDIAARLALFEVTRASAAILGRRLDLQKKLATELLAIPELPRTQEGLPQTLLSPAADDSGHDVIAASYRPAQKMLNYENVGLEPLWPYDTLPDTPSLFQLAKRTYLSRPFVMKEDWSFDPIDAARLQLGDEMRSTLIGLTEHYQTFPNGFSNWGGNFGEFYVEQIGVVATALQMALVQEQRGIIVVAPAVPTGWQMEGSVAVAGNSRVDVRVRDGVPLTVVLESGRTGTWRFRNPWPGRSVDVIAQGHSKRIVQSAQGTNFTFEGYAGEAYDIRPSGEAQTTLAPIHPVNIVQPKRLGHVQLGLFAPETEGPH